MLVKQLKQRVVSNIEKMTLAIILSIVMAMGFAYKVNASPDLAPEELEKAKKIFFNRCAGCHGTLRKGATGPEITDKKIKEKNYDTNIITAFITNGTGGGMPGFSGDFSADEINIMARFLQNPPPVPPEFPLEQMTESWRLIVPPAQRPKKPEHSKNWQNFFGIVLRDAGKVAILDGDSKEVVSIVDTGFAVHILRSSASGRYFYSIGRDGKATMIDLWMAKPDKVAEVKTCNEARSIDSSKYKGKKGDFVDKLAIIGCYWPPHFVILDGQTLEPKKVVSTRSYTYDTGEYHPEPRVAAIISAHHDPEWIINIKESGYIWAIDYTDIKNLKITQIETERFMHDGGWEATVVAWGSDPKGHPQHAWKVVRKVETLGGGSLFVKTHPKANHVWVDHTLNPDDTIKRSICVFEKHHPEEKPQCWQVADHGRVVHFEYNKAGNEVWVAVWDKVGELVIYDDKTLKEKSRIKGDWLVTPTGHFNVYNTMTDTY